MPWREEPRRAPKGRKGIGNDPRVKKSSSAKPKMPVEGLCEPIWICFCNSFRKPFVPWVSPHFVLFLVEIFSFFSLIVADQTERQQEAKEDPQVARRNSIGWFLYLGTTSLSSPTGLLGVLHPDDFVYQRLN